jgi:inhibitor of cysteine peptidase
MVQKEIRKKARVYGFVGILSAIIIVSMIYSFGAGPQIISPNPSPLPSGSPTTELPTNNAQPSAMQTFSSYDELNTFLTNNANRDSSDIAISGSLAPAPMPTAAPQPAIGVNTASLDSSGKAIGEYSITNIQVAGVDEADSVKTDDKYIYTITNNIVYILDAGATNPQNARVLSKISANNTYISGIYLSQDGNKLVVLGNKYIDYVSAAEKDASLIMPPYWNSASTFVKVYDVSNKANPILVRNFTISGNYFNSRMIGNYVYTVVTESVYRNNDGTANLPIVFSETKASNIDATRIFYVNSYDSYYTYTTIFSVNILDNTQAPSNKTIMMGGTSDMYVSTNNIYIVSPTWSSENQYTTNIYRVSINQATLEVEAKGSVWGNPINQYAMDEYNGNFRIATTMWYTDNATTKDGAVFKVSRQMNNIYVLNADLNVIGKLEGFKMDESIYSVRFAEAKCYVVTFKQVDPFFVIDMSNPAAPKVAGELKIPGYSSYLYPIDENHIIGIGKENSTLKLSLFDVTNVNAPTETAKYIVDASYSDSSALYDPHAFLFDAQRQLLIIPVSINDGRIMPFLTSTDGIAAESKIADNWQGVYIFNVNAANGITLKGSVAQVEKDSNLWIERARTIDNTLYTISNSRVQLNNLDNFALLAKIDLN